MKELWNLFIEQEPPVWNAYNQYWIQNPLKVPVHILRYEDLIFHPEKCFTDLRKYVLETNEIDNMLIQKIINEVCNM